MLAYQLIEIVDHLNAATKRLLEPIILSEHIPETLKSEALSLIAMSEILTEHIVDHPSRDALHDGLGDLRSEVEQFMEKIAILARSF
jgi:hypothetical protein